MLGCPGWHLALRHGLPIVVALCEAASKRCQSGTDLCIFYALAMVPIPKVRASFSAALMMCSERATSSMFWIGCRQVDADERLVMPQKSAIFVLIRLDFLSVSVG